MLEKGRENYAQRIGIIKKTKFRKSCMRTGIWKKFCECAWCQEELGDQKALSWRRPRENNCEDIQPVRQEKKSSDSLSFS